MQDALIKAWEKRKTLRDIHQFKPWMTRILSNRCKDILRKRKRWSFFPLEEDTVQVEMPETENAVTEAMKKLKPELRIVMTLHYMDIPFRRWQKPWESPRVPLKQECGTHGNSSAGRSSLNGRKTYE